VGEVEKERSLEEQSPFLWCSMKPEKTYRIPCLDGLRAISIALVIVSHLICARGFPQAKAIARHAYPYYLGNLGVRVFFVISGFLITTLLLREREKTGKVDLAGFYRRRALRIMPVFFAYIAVVLILTAVGVLQVPLKSFLIAGSLTADLFRPDWYFGHFWSLSVEEQFYILWPFAVAAIPESWRSRLLVALFVGGPLLGALCLRASWIPAAEALSSFSTVSAGCLLAILRKKEDWPALRRLFLGRRVLVGCILASVIGLVGNRYSRYVVLATAASILVVMAIDFVTSHPDGPVGRLLNWRPVVFIGLISYSLYIWQELYLRIGVFDRGPQFPLNLAAAFVTALLSYFLVEEPFIRLKNRKSGPALNVARLDAVTQTAD
jgi:peptidoglycan/LPS O-acetylase OafA/YrhL